MAHPPAGTLPVHTSGASSVNEMSGFSISVHCEEGGWEPLVRPGNVFPPH